MYLASCSNVDTECMSKTFRDNVPGCFCSTKISDVAIQHPLVETTASFLLLSLDTDSIWLRLGKDCGLDLIV